MKIVTFKSVSPYFEKERDGIKPNTVRKLDMSDERFFQLVTWAHMGFNDGQAAIVIMDPNEPRRKFIRMIKDITFWNDCVIISWQHPEPEKNEHDN